MTYFERYKNGQLAEVWDELAALGEAVRDPAIAADAMSVAHLTMERVATNIERLIARLASHGYEFGFYLGQPHSFQSTAALVRPDANVRRDLEDLERSAGPLPLSLRGFWDVVGSVSLIGRTPNGWPEYSDALHVDSPSVGLAEFHEWYADIEMRERAAHEGLLCSIAPDVYHRDNVSGGAPYAIELPNPGADALVFGEWHHVRFVPYLRIAILDWGGFPGLSHACPPDQWRAKLRRHRRGLPS